jgi:soluble lytic murein transglycosylase-like protein
MRSPSSLLTALALAAALLGAAPARAGGSIYRYVEKDGTVVYTNVPPAGARRAQKVQGDFRPAPRPDAPVARARPAPSVYEPHIQAAATRYRVPPALVRAVMQAESAYDPRAMSDKGACGLMQLMPDTAREMYVKDIFDPRDNIEGGTRYLRHLANLYQGDMVKMIAAYNAGPEAVKRYDGVPNYAETRAYVAKVLRLYFENKERERAAGTAVAREATHDGDLSPDGDPGNEEPR